VNQNKNYVWVINPSTQFFTLKKTKMNTSMMKNRVTLIGNLGQDPEIKSIGSGRKMARFRIATNERYKNAKDELVEDTQWHSVVAWGKQAESVEKLLKKGSEVLLEGKLTHGDYTDKDGVKRYTTDVDLQSFLVFDKKATAQ
jgi:single-strand DNA-binding protein